MKKLSSPPATPEFTTGLVACIWHRNPKVAANTAETLQVAEIEFRVEQTRALLLEMENRAQQAVEKVERAERRFAELSRALLLLQQEWKKFDEEHDATS